MDIFNIVFQSVLVLIGIGVIGFWITHRHILPESVVGFLSTLVIDIALPATVFASIIANFNPSQLPQWWQLPLWWLAFTVVAAVLMFVFRYVAAREVREEFAISLLFQNAIFFPLIILTGIFGNTPLIAMLFIFVMFTPTLFFGTYSFFFRNAEGPNLRLSRVLNPVLGVTILAVLLRLTGASAHLPEFIVNIASTLGDAALPLIMLVLGASLYLDLKQRGKIHYRELTKFIIVKNLIFPAVFIGLLLVVKPDTDIALLIFMQAVVPPVTAAPILTERGGGKKNVATQFVLASFIASMVTIPAMFLLFNHFFPAALQKVAGG